MESIVVGFDGTEPAFVAVDWVAERAARVPSRVELLRVEPEDLLVEDTEILAFSQAEGRIHDLAPETDVSSRRVGGHVPDALLEAGSRADLLVIGAHLGRPVRAALTGWRPLRTLARSVVPTVVVPGDWNGAEGPILVGVDDDDSSDAAIAFAASEASLAGADLTLLHAWLMPAPTLEGPVALLASPMDVKAAHRRILDDARSRVAVAHPGVTVKAILVQDNPPSALLHAAAGTSLLVLGTHHRGIMAGAFLGSVALDTVPLSPVPVCVVPTHVAGS